MFIPTTTEEVKKRGWKSLDIIIVSGDTYIDSSYNGASIIGHYLIDHGFKVGIICQPDMSSEIDISRLGQPDLFWSVTAGCVDSMVANYTPTNKFRKDDDFTPGGENNRRPDRACIAYTNLIKKYCKGKPIVLGGIEASLRRIAHYDVWSDSVRRSILLDAKADVITYGMAELSNLELACAIRDNKEWKEIKGICYMSSEKPKDFIELPSYEEASVKKDKNHDFVTMFRIFYENCDPVTAKGLVQPHANRFLVQNPPQRSLKPVELDAIYSSDYENVVHPYYAKQGHVKAVETIKNSITTHRGCYGECSFCAIAVHQGRTVVSRTEGSIISEARTIASSPNFNGIIYDVGGPTANMYGIECEKKATHGACKDKRCLYPKPCQNLPLNHKRQIDLLEKLSSIPNVKKVFVTSGVRYDMIVYDGISGGKYLDCIVKDHISGQMKIAPEHTSKKILDLMGKPDSNVLLDFKDMFDDSNERSGKQQFLTYYLMAAHPGCHMGDMEELNRFIHSELKTNPEQVQIFTPTPSTLATMMYHTHRNINDTEDIRVEHSMQMKQRQKDIILDPPGRKDAFKKR
ncbi:MAG: YgiQ family radical SAM protein [Candidatus Methanogranum gryphiswaldense]|nr:MAG: YgiQ family radical SAM protein [Candidatus Methanogranum sp. U3.2.1]